MKLRGCLFMLIAIAGIAFIGAWFALPTAASAAVTGALVTAGFNPSVTHVTVVANPPFKLLSGTADAVRIQSSNVAIASFQAGTVDLTLREVDLTGRSFVSVDGTLGNVTIPTTATSTGSITASVVQVTGPARAAVCTFEIAQSELTTLVQAATANKFGIPIGDVGLLPPDQLRISVGPLGVNGSVTVDPNGRLLLKPDYQGIGSIELYAPKAGDPFRLTGATVTATGLQLTGTLDATAVLP